MRSTHCRRNTSDPRVTHTHTVYLESFRLWQPACSTGLRRCDPAGHVTRRLQVSQCLHTIEFLTFSLMFEIEEQQFPHRSGAHHPDPIEKQSGGHHCLVYICSKQENMQRFDSHKIRQLFKSARLFFPFLSRWSRNTRSFILSAAISMTWLNIELFIFTARPLVNLQHNQLVAVIYVMFSQAADFYLNDNPVEQ